MTTFCYDHCVNRLLVANNIHEMWNVMRWGASRYRTVEHVTDCVQVAKTASYGSKRDEMIRNHPESTLVKLNKIQKV